MLADAQVHATLAVASVLGLSTGLGAADLQAWRDVAPYVTRLTCDKME